METRAVRVDESLRLVVAPTPAQRKKRGVWKGKGPAWSPANTSGDQGSTPGGGATDRGTRGTRAPRTDGSATSGGAGGAGDAGDAGAGVGEGSASSALEDGCLDRVPWSAIQGRYDMAAIMVRNLRRTANGAAWLEEVPDLESAVALAAAKLGSALRQAYQETLPDPADVFGALHGVHPRAVRCVVLGNGPYTGRLASGRSQDCGRAYATRAGMTPQMSAVLHEMEQCGGESARFASPRPEPLEAQGVLLLNLSLTAHDGASPTGHANVWQEVSRAVLGALVNGFHGQPIVFLVWGTGPQRALEYAMKGETLPHDRLAVESPAPRQRGFSGCGCFRKANLRLEMMGAEPVDWGAVVDKRTRETLKEHASRAAASASV